MPIALVLRSDGSAAVDERKRAARQRSLSGGVPVFDEIASALVALRHLQVVEAFWNRRTIRRP
jgi:hypothetical protein